MSQSVSLPSVEERKAFVQKLRQFRGSRPESGQRLLDAMVIAAFTPDQPSEVQGCAWFYGTPEQGHPNPWWYRGSGADAWNGTRWETIYVAQPLSPPSGDP